MKKHKKSHSFEKTIFQCSMLLILFGMDCKAQNSSYEYVPIYDNAVWSVNTLKFMTHGDTVINKKTYLKVYLEEEDVAFEFDINKASYFCALRNDTATKRVYGVYKDTAEVVHVNKDGTTTRYYSDDTTEFLLYDFSLEVGDTISAAVFLDGEVPYGAGYPHSIVIYKFICTSISDSIMMLNDSSLRRRIYMDIVLPIGGNNQYWIESIGSTNGIFSSSAHSYIPYEFPSLRLLCYSVNDIQLIKFPEFDYDEFPDDCYCIGDIRNINEYNLIPEIKMYPNPVQDILTLEIAHANTVFPYRISLFDILGKELQCFEINDKQAKINLSHLNKGLYIIRITQSKNLVLYGKIIKN